MPIVVDEYTANLNYPKPHPSNDADDDCLRLRQFMDDVDLDVSSRPTQASVTAEIAAAVAPLASVSYVDSGLAGKVPTSRTVSAGSGLTGGGALSGDITISLDAGSLSSLSLADSAVQPGTTVFAGTGLTGGGTLASNITIGLSSASQASLALANTSLQSVPTASQAQAETGTASDVYMTPQRTAQHAAANPPGVPVVGKTAAHILADSDNGKTISITTGGVTVPSSLTPGTTVCVYNNSGSSQAITQGAGVTLRSAGTTATGNRTLLAYGLVTVTCVAAGVSVVTGAGLS